MIAMAMPKLGPTGDITVNTPAAVKRFRFIATERNWPDAQAYCQSLKSGSTSGSLAEPDTKQLAEALLKAHQQAGRPAGATGGFWIGLRSQDGNFTTCPLGYWWGSGALSAFTVPSVHHCWPADAPDRRRRLLATPVGTGGCVIMKRKDTAPIPYVENLFNGNCLWVGWPCDSTLAPFFCEL